MPRVHANKKRMTKDYVEWQIREVPASSWNGLDKKGHLKSEYAAARSQGWTVKELPPRPSKFKRRKELPGIEI